MKAAHEPDRRSDSEIALSWLGAVLKLFLILPLLGLVLLVMYALVGWWGVALPVLFGGALIAIIHYGRRD